MAQKTGKMAQKRGFFTGKIGTTTSIPFDSMALNFTVEISAQPEQSDVFWKKGDQLKLGIKNPLGPGNKFVHLPNGQGLVILDKHWEGSALFVEFKFFFLTFVAPVIPHKLVCNRNLRTGVKLWLLQDTLKTATKDVLEV